MLGSVTEADDVSQAATFSNLGLVNRLVLVNDDVGVVSRLPDGRLFSVIGFTVVDGRVVEMDILADQERLARLELPVPGTGRRA